MLAELAGVRPHRPHLALERRGEVDGVVDVVPHHQEHLADPMRGEARGRVRGVVQGGGCPEVDGVDDGEADGPVVGVELELPIAWRSGVRVVGDDGIRALFPDQAGHLLGEPRSGPGQLAIRVAEKGQPWPAQRFSRRSLLGFAQDREPRASHGGVIVPLVAAREDDGVDRVPLVEPSGDGPAGMDIEGRVK